MYVKTIAADGAPRGMQITPTLPSATDTMKDRDHVQRLLMIAFHYPPFQGSSGVLRTLNFSRYLPHSGWQPSVLTATTHAYEKTQSKGEGALGIPPSVSVTRALAFDAGRHFAIGGRYPRALALPDRWLSWYPSAVFNAMRIIRRERPKLIWSTYPIATAHLVAHRVAQKSGLPWVADFRDSMTEDTYPTDPRQRAMFLRIEQRTVDRATAIVFTTEGARRMYRERYPQIDPQKFHVLPNGYDEDAFRAAEAKAQPRSAKREGPLVLLHSGVLYPSERDPRPFLRALSRLKQRGIVDATQLRIVLRATGHDALIAQMLAEFAVGDLVQIAPSVSYGQALVEMLEVDALLLLQAANSNHQIPAKLYEYLRTGSPVLALTDHAGDSAAALRAAGSTSILDIANAEEIEAGLPEFLQALRESRVPVANRRYVAQFSREGQAAVLAELLTKLCG
jgi:glycosyltransferase involved in cell wall biosynthesis